MLKPFATFVLGSALLAGTLVPKAVQAADAAATAPRSGLPFANGKRNLIIAAGATRAGAVFTFAKVQSEGNGWLVLYRIIDGVPQGNTFAGASYVRKGVNQNVTVKVNYTPVAGEHLVVMLHRDVNENKKFDFIFDDAGKIQDAVVRENGKMVARIFSSP